MRGFRNATRVIALAAVAGALLPPSARAGGAPIRDFEARGPLALTVSAEPTASRWALESGWPLFRGTPRSATSPAPGGLRLGGLLLASSDSGPRDGRTSFAGTAFLEHRTPTVARWVGVSLGEVGVNADPGSRARFGAGAAGTLGGFEAAASLVSTRTVFRDDPRWTRTVYYRYQPAPESTGVWRDSSETFRVDHHVTWTLAQGSLAWRGRRFSVETAAGLTVGELASLRRWAQARLRLQLRRSVLALASVGQRPAASLAFDGSGGRGAMLGLQWAPWSTREWEMSGALRPRLLAWRTEPAGPGFVVVRLHCPDASRVEIAGDFTDWEPVGLLRLNGSWWGARVRADSGPHRVQVRLDGGPWAAPRGLPRAADGPRGEAGTLVVP